MPIDASIYNNLNTQPNNPFKMVGDAASVANALQQNQLLQTKNQREQVGLSADQAALAMQKYKNLAERILPLANDPDLSHKKIINGVVQAIADGTVSPEEGNNFLGSLGEDNPQQNRAIMQSLGMRLLDANAKMEQMYGKPTQVANGANIISGVTAPASAGGGFQGSTATPIQLSPEQKVYQNQTYDAAKKAPGRQSVGEQYDSYGNPKGGMIDLNDPTLEQDLRNAVDKSGSETIPTGGKITQTAPALGEQEAATGAVKGLNDLYDSVRGTGPRIFQLQQALHGLQNTTTGPGTETTNRIKSFLLAQSPDALKNIGVTPDDINVANYDKANKYLTQYASSAASSGGYQTDAKLATALSGNASTKISNLAAQDVVKAAIALERMQQAQAQAFQQSGQPDSAFNKWQVDWNKNVDPRVFMMDELTPKQRSSVISGLSKDEKARFAAQLRSAIKGGFVSSPGQ